MCLLSLGKDMFMPQHMWRSERERLLPFQRWDLGGQARPLWQAPLRTDPVGPAIIPWYCISPLYVMRSLYCIWCVIYYNAVLLCPSALCEATHAHGMTSQNVTLERMKVTSTAGKEKGWGKVFVIRWEAQWTFKQTSAHRLCAARDQRQKLGAA